MRKPTIGVTKWRSDIPVEAGCSACPGVVFRGSSHRPNREEFSEIYPGAVRRALEGGALAGIIGGKERASKSPQVIFAGGQNIPSGEQCAWPRKSAIIANPNAQDCPDVNCRRCRGRVGLTGAVLPCPYHW
jgi:hypothetical protein